MGLLVIPACYAIFRRCCFAAVIWGLLSGTPVTATSFTLTTAPDVPVAGILEGQPGPWGRLHYTRIAIDPPKEFLNLDPNIRYDHCTWAFRGHLPVQVEKIFRKAKLSPNQLQTILEDTKWEKMPEGTIVFPPRDFVLGLSPFSRQAVYSVLERFEENSFQYQPFTFHPDLLDEQFINTGVAPSTIAAFRRLLYPRGKALRFADAGVFMDTLPDLAEKNRFFQAISRRCTLLVKLHVSSASNLDEMVDYWAYAGRPKLIRPLFESLARVPDGTKIDIVHLLPPFARKRIYTFPDPDDTKASERNCHWTAFNFFNDPADDRFCQPDAIQQAVQKEYEPVTGDWRLGDVVVLFDSAGDAIHSAVYIADDLVYTKNGGGTSQPWIYMHLRDVLDLYLAPDGTDNGLSMVVFRKKKMTPPE